MTPPEPAQSPLELGRPRDIGALFADGFGVYLRNLRTFVAIAAAVVVPVQLIVGGIGLGELTADYDSSPNLAQQAIPVIAAFFVIAPLMTAMCIYALLDIGEGRPPSARSAIQRGLDVFAPLLVVVLLYAAALALGLAAFVIPAIYLFVRLRFATQSVVIEGTRGVDALRASWALVDGQWWRVFAITIAVELVVGGLSAIVGLPFLSAAESTGSAAFQLAGTIIGGVLFAAPAAIITTLLYFDLRARKGASL